MKTDTTPRSRLVPVAALLLVAAAFAYFLLTGVLAFRPLATVRLFLVVLAFYLAYRLVRAVERLADATERSIED